MRGAVSAKETRGSDLPFLRGERTRRGKARHMIGVFVGNQNCVEVFRLLADFGQAARQFLHAEPRIDQNARFRGGEERRVSRTATGQHAKSVR